MTKTLPAGPMPDKGPDKGNDRIEMKARVMEALPSALFKVQTLGENGQSREATAHCAASNALRVRPGDVVVVEFSPFDLSRGRIVRCVLS